MKTVLVTGGTKGIGRAIAAEFFSPGHAGINQHGTGEGGDGTDEEAALATQSEFNMLGYCPVLMRADVGDEEQVDDMFAEIFRNYERIDVLVNNAGISRVNVIQDTTAAEWDRIFAVNARGTFLCSRAVADRMIVAGGGCIINIASIWGEVGASCEAAYSASKAAVIGFTKALSKELAPSGVRVNCVSPGVIDTQMNAHLSAEELEDLTDEIPLGRMGSGEDVAKACLFLAENSYITGETLSVGGSFGK